MEEQVGTQYYGGVIHAGELANLVREPKNKFDANARRAPGVFVAKIMPHLKIN